MLGERTLDHAQPLIEEILLDGVVQVLCTWVVVSGCGVELKVPGQGTQFQACGPDVRVLVEMPIPRTTLMWQDRLEAPKRPSPS